MTGRIMLALIAASMLAGCKDGSMQRQNRYGTYTPAALFPDNTEAQQLPAGTVSQTDLARARDMATPPRVDAALLARGRERYEIFCTPCHGVAGHGDGMIMASRRRPPITRTGCARRRAATSST
jgi:mono/diheme cytochrome c family protein